MASLTNNDARLIWGPRVPGFIPPRWLPGKNMIDAKYWAAAKKNGAVKRWLALDMIEVDLDEDVIRFHALRRREPTWQPLLQMVEYHFPRRRFHE